MAHAIDRMTRLGELLDQCLALTPSERRAWLDALAKDDSQLVQGLRDSLLADNPAAAMHGPLDQLPRIDLAGQDGMGTGRQAGDRFGAYELLRPLGAGGMAEVWLACRADGAFERLVALKIPRLRGMRDEVAARFGRECRILASLEYPGIARLYDAGIDAGGVPFIAMEYVRGDPLVEWCNARKLDVTARIRLFMQVLDAVDYAHQRHVLHRDLKPSNILVTGNGEVRLLDFGVARLLQGDAGGGAARSAWGSAMTPGYASPEMLRGEPLDLRSDIYSLGVVLHELLTGTRPSPGQQSRSARFGVPAALQGVLDKALARLPADRYAGAADFEFALRQFLRAADRRPRHRPVRYLVAALAVLATAGAALWYQRQGLPAAAPSAGPVAAIPLAVMPFDSPGEAGEVHAAVGFAETLAGHLRQVPELGVVGVESTRAFSGNDEAGRIARDLGVSYVLKGSYRRDAGALHVKAVLVDGRNGSILLEEEYSPRGEQQLSGLLDEISVDIATSLAVKLDIATLTQDEGGTSSLVAADNYWRWRQFVREDYPIEQDVDELIVALREAVALDPTFLLARDGLAEALRVKAGNTHGQARWIERIASGLAAEEAGALGNFAAMLHQSAEGASRESSAILGKLEEIAPHSWIALKNSAYRAALDERWDDAEKYARMVSASRPLTLEKIKPLADVLFAMGRIEETIELEAEEGRLAPLSTWISRNQQYNYFAAGRAAEAEAEYQRSRAMQGNKLDLQFLSFVRLLADPDADVAELRARYPERNLAPGSPQWRLDQDLISALGDRQRMLDILRQHFRSGENISHLMADALGDATLAMQAFSRGWEEARYNNLSRAYFNIWLMPNSGMRALPEFRQLLEEIGLVKYWRESKKWADACAPVGEHDFQCH